MEDTFSWTVDDKLAKREETSGIEDDRSALWDARYIMNPGGGFGSARKCLVSILSRNRCNKQSVPDLSSKERPIHYMHSQKRASHSI